MSIDAGSRIWKMMQEAESLLLASHVNPDGDAIGSMTALAEALQGQGKRVTMVLPSRSNGRYKKMPGVDRIIIAGSELGPDDAARLAAPHDLMVLLDVSTWEQLRGLHEQVKAHAGRLIVIDHHRSRDDLGQVELVDEQAAATGEIVQTLLESQGMALTASMAESLLVAIGSDTGWMRFPSVTAETFRRVARLQEAGADPTGVYRQLYQSYSAGKVRLAGEAILNMGLSDDGRVADMCLTQEMFSRTGTTMRDSESIIDECNRVDTVEVSILIVELDASHVRASLRSRDGVDVDRVAGLFGGGGHARAAGCRIAMSVVEARQALLQAVHEALAEASSA